MSQTTSIYLYVNGSYIPYNAQYEYTSGEVTNAWGTAINPLISLYNTVSAQGTPPNITQAQATEIQNALEQLVSLAQTGVTKTQNGITKTSYLTYTMATNLNQLLITLQNAGITITPNFAYKKDSNGDFILDSNGNPIIDPASVNSRGNLYTASGVTVQNLTVWRDLAASTPIIQSALAASQTEAETGTRSLQSLVELEFVSAGNQIITQQLADLQAQLTTTKGILDTLTNLQNLHNNLVINGKSAFSSIFKFSLGRPATMPNVTMRYTGAIGLSGLTVGGFAYNITYASLGVGEKAIFAAGLNPTNAASLAGTAGITPTVQFKTVFGANIGSPVTFPSLYSTTIPNSFIEAIAAGQLAGAGIPAMGIPSARIVAYAGISQTVDTPAGFQGFVTVSKVYSKLPTWLQAFYKDHQDALIAKDSFAKSGLYYDKADIDAGGNPDFVHRPSAGNKFSETVVNATYEAIYGKYASAYFGQPVIPALPSSIIYNEANFQTAKNKLVTYRNNLVSAIATLTAQATSAQISNDNSLLNQLKTVLSDINQTFVTPSGKPIQLDTGYLDAFQGFRDWMMDNYDHYTDPSAPNAGLYQQHITQAITAGSSTNDDQKQQVQRAIYLFQEFYKAASSILQALTQIITKFAQNISR